MINHDLHPVRPNVYLLVSVRQASNLSKAEKLNPCTFRVKPLCCPYPSGLSPAATVPPGAPAAAAARPYATPYPSGLSPAATVPPAAPAAAAARPAVAAPACVAGRPLQEPLLEQAAPERPPAAESAGARRCVRGV